MTSRLPNKVCHCSVLHRLDDSRIFYKECVTLALAGYDVTYIAKPSFSPHFQSSSYKGVKLQKLRSNVRLINNLSLFFSILQQRMLVVHFHDSELIPMGLVLKLFGKKVIYDVHENVRQDIMHKAWLRPALRVVLSKVAIFMEYAASIFFNGIVAATPTIASNFKNKRTVVIRNLPTLKKQNSLNRGIREKNVIIYVGALTEARGIKELIAAVGNFSGSVELWLLGGWSSIQFKSDCESMHGFRFTKYYGLVDHEIVTQYLSRATIGICTLHPLDTFKDSYPIKVFEYMESGLPVLMSNFKMWVQFFENACEYVDPLNSHEIALKIVSLLENPSRLEEMSALGEFMIHKKLNWGLESHNLENLYKKI
jgi:glycosyltransferase involved in cell wall biosynthesis